MNAKASAYWGKIRSSRLAKDSFWAVFGNGLGYGFLMLAGIVIANFLGVDAYGEFGIVKTTMLYIAGFATLGLGISSTKYIANALKEDRPAVRSLSHDAIQITLVFSALLAAGLFIAANPLARFLDEPGLAGAFRILGVIIVCKALNTTQNGILAGFGDFRAIARNNVISSLAMLTGCVPLTCWFRLDGALGILFFSQALNALLNWVSLRRLIKGLSGQKNVSRKRELCLFSFPIALQELNYTVCSWGGIMLLTKLSSSSQVGLYTAAAMWNGVITFIPGLLSNVILSHLSGTAGDKASHRHTLKTMLGVNFITTIIPFAAVYLLAGLITGFYGPTFTGLESVLRIMTLATVFSACSTVLYSELISRGHNWLSFLCRIMQEGTLFAVGWVLLVKWSGQSGAVCFACAYLISAIVSFSAPLLCVALLRNRCIAA